MTDRRIILTTIRNCRDLGSLENKNGQHIKKDHLLRAAEFSSASNSDLITLNNEHRLVEVIDLRTYKEIEQRPDLTIDSITIKPNPVINILYTGISHENSTDGRPHYLPVNMGELYYGIMTEDYSRNNLHDILTEIMTHDYTTGSLLWHCTEGKDRCGIVSMLVLLALDVDYEIIRDDYLLTNETNKARADDFYQYLINRGEDPEHSKYAYDIFLARPEYLDKAYSAVTAYPDIYTFFEESLNISSETINEFRSKVLE